MRTKEEYEKFWDKLEDKNEKLIIKWIEEKGDKLCLKYSKKHLKT